MVGMLVGFICGIIGQLIYPDSFLKGLGLSVVLTITFVFLINLAKQCTP